MADARHHELGGAAGLAALLFPGAGTDLSDETERGGELNGVLDHHRV
jgi:hypothetical protein